jgi:hypothetical protein
LTLNDHDSGDMIFIPLLDLQRCAAEPCQSVAREPEGDGSAGRRTQLLPHHPRLRGGRGPHPAGSAPRIISRRNLKSSHSNSSSRRQEKTPPFLRVWIDASR